MRNSLQLLICPTRGWLPSWPFKSQQLSCLLTSSACTTMYQSTRVPEYQSSYARSPNIISSFCLFCLQMFTHIDLYWAFWLKMSRPCLPWAIHQVSGATPGLSLCVTFVTGFITWWCQWRAAPFLGWFSIYYKNFAQSVQINHSKLVMVLALFISQSLFSEYCSCWWWAWLMLTRCWDDW